MLKYLIVGVLDTLDPHHGTHPTSVGYTGVTRTIHKDVVWGGPHLRRVYVWETREANVTDGHAHMRVKFLATPYDGEMVRPYGYSNLRHALKAIELLVGRGSAWKPLKNVHSLHPIPVLLLRDGTWQLIGDDHVRN